MREGGKKYDNVHNFEKVHVNLSFTNSEQYTGSNEGCKK